MITIEATIPCLFPPAWALYERELLTLMDRAVDLFLSKYTDADGRLLWRQTMEESWQMRDGVDDFYESFFNWPLLYLLGGADRLLSLSHRQWEAVTAQLTDLGMVKYEYDLGYDQFHQGEGNLFFYLLCIADPTNSALLARVQRFASFYLNEDPAVASYDADRRLIRAPHHGSAGPRWGFFDGEPCYPWDPSMAIYGLPYQDVAGIASFEDLKDSALACRMGAVMQDRMGRGDVAVNLAVTSLLTTAYLLTGEQKYRQWVLDYVQAWEQRAQRNGGIVPDNVGEMGQIGENMQGKWYGGLYGWNWPHGFHSIGAAVLVAATNALLLSGETSSLDLARMLLDRLMDQGREADLGELEMSLRHHWLGIEGALDEGQRTFVIPFRYGDQGWFDWQPVPPEFPVTLWYLSQARSDRDRLEHFRLASHYDWRRVIAFRNKGENGHEAPWERFIRGDNAGYPEAILSETYGQVCRRLALIQQDRQELSSVSIHHWQDHNPVMTEALVQLTLGAPALIYNGGLLQASLRYFDGQRTRPGLPPDMAALVQKIMEEGVSVRLVNLSPWEERSVIVQAGAFGEHQIISVSYEERTSEYPGRVASYAPPEMQSRQRTIAVEQPWLQVHFAPATEITLELALARFVHQPSAAFPWQRQQ